MSVESPPPDRERASLLQVAKAVFWSFFGVRKAKDLDRDATNITPLQVVVAGVIGAAILVFCLIMLVRVVVH